MKVFCEDFIFLQFGFVIFCQKNIVKEVAHKLLVKLTIGDNFTFSNQLLYVKVFCAFIVCLKFGFVISAYNFNIL